MTPKTDPKLILQCVYNIQFSLYIIILIILFSLHRECWDFLVSLLDFSFLRESSCSPNHHTRGEEVHWGRHRGKLRPGQPSAGEHTALFFFVYFTHSPLSHTHTRTHARTHARTHTCTHARKHEHTHTHTHSKSSLISHLSNCCLLHCSGYVRPLVFRYPAEI